MNSRLGQRTAARRDVEIERPAKPLRALVEITGRELRIMPIADSDAEERVILDALRFATRSTGNDACGI